MKLLIVRLSSMGDIVHALPLAANARAAGAAVGWIVEKTFAALLEGNPDVDRLFVADTRGWRRGLLGSDARREIGALWRSIRDFSPDYTIDPQGNWKSAVIARSAGSPSIGFSRAARREPASAALCSLPVTPNPLRAHVVDRNLSLLSPAGIEVVRRSPDASYLTSRASESPEADRFLAAQPRPFVLLHPGATRPEKAWGEERFAHLARAFIRDTPIVPVVSWGPGDERRAERLRSLLPKKPPLPALGFGGLARVIRASALFVAGDTGPLHLADALGVPTLALFGAAESALNEPARNGPYRDRRGIVSDMHGVSDEAVFQLAMRLIQP